MIKFYFLVLFSFLFTTSLVQANTITVKGYVTLTNGSPAKNVEVRIASYLVSPNTSCSEQTVVTDNAGFYSKEMTCTGGDIRKSRVTVINCNGQALVQEKEVSSTKIVEANFTICVAAPPACAAKFTTAAASSSSTVPAFSIRFNASGSEVGDKDTIIHRTWDFHDGTPLLYDRVDPTHTFPHAGTYEVCLIINTVKRCESRICAQVVVQPVLPVTCSATFTFEKLTPKKFRFNSSASVTTATDNIIERKWNFGDGTTSSDIAPAHEFPHYGNYEVCLTIKTAKGCESKVCVPVKVEETSQSNDASIIIVSLYPIPVHENLMAVIYSKTNNIQTTISILDLYGKVQLSQLVNLSQGNNSIKTRVLALPAGSYYYKVTTPYGVISKSFYKL
jgi:PKD repeat protein